MTGATGFVGVAVARALFVRVGRSGARPRLGPRNVQHLALTVVEGNLSDRPSLYRALEGCDALFHVAADYRLGAFDPRELYQTTSMEPAIPGRFGRAGLKRVVYTQ